MFAPKVLQSPAQDESCGNCNMVNSWDVTYRGFSAPIGVGGSIGAGGVCWWD